MTFFAAIDEVDCHCFTETAASAGDEGAFEGEGVNGKHFVELIAIGQIDLLDSEIMGKCKSVSGMIYTQS